MPHRIYGKAPLLFNFLAKLVIGSAYGRIAGIIDSASFRKRRQSSAPGSRQQPRTTVFPLVLPTRQATAHSSLYFPELTPAVSTPLLGKNTAENTELHPLSMDRGISLTGQSPRKSHQSQLAACKCYFGGHKSHQCDGRFAATFERRCNFRRFLHFAAAPCPP